MSNYKPYSYVEKKFIEDCKNISEYIDPNIFLSRYNKFSKDYWPFFEKDLKYIYKLIKEKFPNSDFALKGRIKSKYSLCKKTKDKLYCYFNYDKEEDSKKRKQLETYIGTVLKTISDSNELQAILKNQSISSNNKLNIIYKQLDKKSREKLTFYLGLSDDIYAYRLITRSTGFNISDCHFKNNKLYIQTPEGNEVLVETPIKLKDPELIKQIQDVHSSKKVKDTRISTTIHRKKEEININNIKTKDDKTLDFNEDGSLTLLRDAFELPDGSTINVTSNNIINIDNEAYLKDHSIGIIPIKNLILKKYDEPFLIKDLYNMTEYISDIVSKADFGENESMQIAQGRYKDYIKSPKPSGYSSIHLTFLKMFFNKKLNKQQTTYSEEIQARTQLMESDTKNPNSKISHNNYKSSKDDLSRLVKNPNIELSDLFPSYILVTSFNNKGTITPTTWKPSLKYSIEHILPNESYEDLIHLRASNDTVFEVLDYDNEIEIE